MTKRAMVTGASEGIGRVFAKALVGRGYAVRAVARSEAKLKELAAEVGSGVEALAADLSTAEGQRKAAEALEAGGFDLLVNNAGVGLVGPFADAEVDKLLAMLRLNCEAVVALSHAFLKGAKAGDALVNVSSTLAFMPSPGLGTYAATKAFVTSFSEALWYEQRDRGVYVMGLCPGITSTRFQENAGGRKEDVPQNMAQTPEQVVDEALAALDARRSPTVITGVQNKAGAMLSRALPRKAMVSVMGKAMMKR